MKYHAAAKNSRSYRHLITRSNAAEKPFRDPDSSCIDYNAKGHGRPLFPFTCPCGMRLPLPTPTKQHADSPRGLLSLVYFLTCNIAPPIVQRHSSQDSTKSSWEAQAAKWWISWSCTPSLCGGHQSLRARGTRHLPRRDCPHC